MSDGTRIQPHRLVLVGSVLIDILLYIDRLPERGGDILALKSMLTSGGGFNILVGARRLGMTVAYAGRVGDGPMGAQVMADLAREDIPLLLPRVQGEDTGFDVALVEQDAERTFITVPGSESHLQPDDLRGIPLVSGDAIYVSGYELCYPVSGASLEQWLPSLPISALLLFDPGPLAAEIPAQRLALVLARVDVLSLNAREAYLLTGQSNPAVAVQLLRSRLAPDAWAVVRTGAQGCWISGAACTPQYLAPRPARAIDTTGAGDTHCAALLARLAAGDDFSTAARIANVAASISVEREGPAAGPTAQELQEALATQLR